MNAWCFLICDTVLHDARFYDVLDVFASAFAPAGNDERRHWAGRKADTHEVPILRE